jgi:parallel beta-helix repeat protein
VLNNEIRGDPGAPMQYAGILVYVANVPGSVEGITLSGNTINNQRDSGIHLTAGTGTGGSVTIAGNQLLNNGGYGIVVNRGFADVTVENNTARGNAKADYHGDVPVRGGKNAMSRTEGQRISP